MATGIFRVGRGTVAELGNRVVNGDPAASRFLLGLYTSVPAVATLEAYATHAALDAGCTEATATGYSTVLNNVLSGITVTVNANDTQVTCNDFTWASIGGATNNTLTTVVLFYTEQTTDLTTAIPVVWHDFPFTTTGTALTFRAPTNGFYITG